MRFYSPGDDIYMFGFSRGAYTARFLAEMIDHVGIVAPGNEEMVAPPYCRQSGGELLTQLRAGLVRMEDVFELAATA